MPVPGWTYSTIVEVGVGGICVEEREGAGAARIFRTYIRTTYVLSRGTCGGEFSRRKSDGLSVNNDLSFSTYSLVK